MNRYFQRRFRAFSAGATALRQRRRERRYLLPAAALFSLCCLLLCGCTVQGNLSSAQNSPEEGAFTAEVYAMDTRMTLRAYGETAEEAIGESSKKLYALDGELSAVQEGSQIFALNNRLSDRVTGDAAAVLSESIRMSKLTEHFFDISIYPVVDAWGFSDKDYRVPDRSEIAELLAHTGMDRISFDGQTGVVSFADDQMKIDVGAIAKGYASDLAAEIFRSHSVSSGTISLGGNVCAFGSKPDGSDWSIAIQDPFHPSDANAYAGMLTCSDCFLVTSGSYQRCFTEDGKRYGHIIDPSTGMPTDNGLESVTIVSESGTEADALSTALYVMGLDRACDFWRSCSDLRFDAILITDDGQIYVTEGIADSFQSGFGIPKVVRK